MGSISLTGDPRRLPAEPGVPGMIKAPDPYCYRCPFELTHPACKLRCVEYIDEMLYLEGDTIAGIVVEPIVGSNGILVPPDGYMPRLKQSAEAHKALLIVDEVMTGFGRTGAWFAVQHWGVEPDILTMAKGLTGAYFPLGATMVSREISEFFHGHIFSHGHTYTGHPVGCAAALAAISVYRDEGLIEHARQMGAYLQVALRDLAARHRSVGDVRGIGLFWGLEIVRDRATKEPFTKPGGQLSRTDTVPQKVCREALKLGVYVVGMANTLIIAPPLIVTKDELDYGISVLDRALEVADAETS